MLLLFVLFVVCCMLVVFLSLLSPFVIVSDSVVVGRLNALVFVAIAKCLFQTIVDLRRAPRQNASATCHPGATPTLTPTPHENQRKQKQR